MRSRAEIAFRLAQEGGNVCMWLVPPRSPGEQPSPLPALPDPGRVAARLRGTAYASAVERTAGEILAHRFPVLGTTIDTGPQIEWRRDYSGGITTPPRYYRFIPYLDAGRAGDHKFVWELSRHQHWVLLAQAFLLTNRQEFLDEIAAEFASWEEQNPFLVGMNWTSALEAAFRAFSWMWVYHLVGAHLEPDLRRRLLRGLYRHGRYLERNLSIYFSPNTHLLGEAVVLHALGALMPDFPRAAGWRKMAGQIVREQMSAQVREDGSHFEQSSYYHVYSLDMFLFHALIEQAPPEYLERLARMAAYLNDLLGPQRRLPFLGDDDGGRFFHPYGERDRFGLASLATCSVFFERTEWCTTDADIPEQAAWWLGASAVPPGQTLHLESKRYRNAGVFAMTGADTHLIVDAGEFGAGSGGHSHSDTLSIVLRAGGDDVLIDPGTYTYVGSAEWRDRFRGSAAHNTVRAGGRDQAIPSGPFRWLAKPRVEVRSFRTTAASDTLHALVRYGSWEHARRILFVKPHLIFVLDEINGPEGEQIAEQFWHAGGAVRDLRGGAFSIGERAVLAISEPGEVQEGWRSSAFGMKVPAPVIRVEKRAVLPLQFAAMIDLSGGNYIPRVAISRAGPAGVEITADRETRGLVRFHAGAEPDWSL